MLDFVLASALLFGMPGYALLRGYLYGEDSVDKPKRYRRSIAIIAVFLMILFVDWVSGSRGLAQLGLAAPTTHSAIAGCLVALFVPIIVFLALIAKSKVQKAAEPDGQADTILPESRDELRSFVIFAIAAGFGWEVLYRGFLLFCLSPIIGLVPAVAASSIAYGCAHGCKTVTQTAGSLISALLFTTGYAATGSLWWLIILHIGLPLVSMLGFSRIKRTVVTDRSG
jgi:membrane protease YdiL (CAAX protease family)